MMVLFLSSTGDLLPLASRVEGEGHKVALHINDERYTDRGRGHVKDRTGFLGPLLSLGNVLTDQVDTLIEQWKPDLVVADEGMGKVATYCKGKGIREWGANRWSDLVHSGYGEKLLASVGVEPIPQPPDCEVGIGALADGDKLYSPFLYVVEEGMMNRGVGLGLVGGVCIQVVSEKHPLFMNRLKHLEGVVKKTGHKGLVTLSGCVSTNFSLPLFTCLYELTKGRVVDLLMGEKVDVVRQWASCLHISIPPFPIPANQKHIRKMKMSKGARKHVWLVDATNESVGVVNGDVGYISGRGSDEPQATSPSGDVKKDEVWEVNPLREARRRTLRTVSNIKRENKLKELQYRTDIGVRAWEVLNDERIKGA